MKKMHALFFLTAVGLCSMAFRPVVVPFEGTIRYETSVTGEVPKAVADRIAKYYDVRFKGTDLKISGEGPLKGEILMKKNLGKLYIIRPDQKNVYELDLKDSRISENTSTPAVTRLKETSTIAGYVCQKYQIQYNGDLKLNVWTTFSLQEVDWGTGIFGGQFKLPSKVEGFPLKFELVSTKFTLTGTATVVKYSSMDALEFSVPSGMAAKKL